MEQKIEQQELMDFNDFVPLFGMWSDLFKPFIESREMYEIYEKIKKDAKRETIVPLPDNTFKVFQLSDPNDIKAIIYAQDPYPRRYKAQAGERWGKYQADGIALSCSNSPDGKLQPSLEQFYKALKKDTKVVETNSSLDYLIRQGVLLINTDLTCKLNKTASHEGYWEKFQKFFLEDIMGAKVGIPYILSGKASHKLEKYINPLASRIFKIEHPSYADRNSRDWEHKDIFRKIDTIVKENGKKPIMWSRDEWEKSNTPPF